MPTENRAVFIQKNVSGAHVNVLLNAHSEGWDHQMQVRHSFRENRALQGQQQEAGSSLVAFNLAKLIEWRAAAPKAWEYKGAFFGGTTDDQIRFKGKLHGPGICAGQAPTASRL
eukprot:765226-Pelagomonas_calceolata.AAC.3